MNKIEVYDWKKYDKMSKENSMFFHWKKKGTSTAQLLLVLKKTGTTIIAHDSNTRVRLHSSSIVYSILTRLLNSFSTATVNLGCCNYFLNIWVFRHYCTYQWYDPINRWFDKKTKKKCSENEESILRSNPEKKKWSEDHFTHGSIVWISFQVMVYMQHSQYIMNPMMTW